MSMLDAPVNFAPVRAEIAAAAMAAAASSRFGQAVDAATAAIATAASFTASGLTNAQSFPALSGTTVLRTNFRYVGCDVAQAGSTFPTFSLVGAVSNSNSTDVGFITVKMGHIGTQLEIPWYGRAGSIRVVAEDSRGADVELLRAAPAIASGTAQGGGASSITLTAGSSASDGAYNQNWVYINSGTGAGSFAPVIGYVGATKVATVDPTQGTWVAPDATSVYEVRKFKSPFTLPGIDGSIKNILLTFPSAGPRVVRIEIAGSNFYGVRTNSTGGVFPVARTAQRRAFVAGDSYAEGTGADFRSTALSTLLARGMGCEPWVCCSGGTGYLNGSGTAARMTIVDRIAPPVNSWTFSNGGATGGTFTLSFGGQATTALAFNASPATVQAALQALSSVGASNVIVADYLNGNCASRMPILFRNALASVATPLTLDASGLTGTFIAPVLAQYGGDIAPYLPKDGNGTALPFDIYLVGGHNDSTDTNPAYTTAALQAAVTGLIQTLQTRFPSASIYMSGVLYVPGNSPAAAIAANTALAAAATASLRKINGYVPFVDTLSPSAWATGSGNIGTPATAGISTSLTWYDNVHPSQMGHYWFKERLCADFQKFKFGY